MDDKLKAMGFKDFVVANPSMTDDEYLAYQAQKRRRGHFDTYGESVEHVDEGSAAKHTEEEKFLIKHLSKAIREFDPYDDDDDDRYNGWGETPREEYEDALDEIEKIAGKKVRKQLEVDYKSRSRNKVKSDLVGKRSSQFSDQKPLRDYGTKNTKKVRATDVAKKKFKKAVRDRLGAHKKAMKGKLPESVEQVDEVLSLQQRKKVGQRMKRMSRRIQVAKKRALKKAASPDVLQKRARKQAKSQMIKKWTSGKGKGELSVGRKAELEKRLKKAGGKVDRNAKRLIPQLRKLDRERRSSAGSTEKK